VIAFGIAQHAKEPTAASGSEHYRNVRLFDFLDGEGNSLFGNANDPEGAVYGKTVPDSLLASVAAGVKAIRVDIVTEGSFKNPVTQSYPGVRVTGTINPRNLNRGAGAGYFAELSPDSTAEGLRIARRRNGHHGRGRGDASHGASARRASDPHPEQERGEPLRGRSARAGLAGGFQGHGGQPARPRHHDRHGRPHHQQPSRLVRGLPRPLRGERLYNVYPSYYETTARQLNALASADLDGDTERPDMISAVSTTDTQGASRSGSTVHHPRGWVGSAPRTPSQRLLLEREREGAVVGTADFDQDGTSTWSWAPARRARWGRSRSGTTTARESSSSPKS